MSRRLQAALAGVVVIAALATTLCNPSPPDYTFSFSADDDNEVYVTKAAFDGRRVPVGIIGCCLSWGGRSASMFFDFYPSTAVFEWHDGKRDRWYTATLKYPENLEEIARSLDATYRVESYKHPVAGSVELITSFTNDNEVISWIANAGWGPAVISRDIREIGRAWGVEDPSLAPRKNAETPSAPSATQHGNQPRPQLDGGKHKVTTPAGSATAPLSSGEAAP